MVRIGHLFEDETITYLAIQLSKCATDSQKPDSDGFITWNFNNICESECFIASKYAYIHISFFSWRQLMTRKHKQSCMMSKRTGCFWKITWYSVTHPVVSKLFSQFWSSYSTMYLTVCCLVVKQVFPTTTASQRNCQSRSAVLIIGVRLAKDEVGSCYL